MEVIKQITIEFETYRITLKGEAAEKWFNAMVKMLHGSIPPEIGMSEWKKRKKNAK